MPGLQWLKNDTIIRNDDPDVDSKTSPTFPADEEYISFFEENVSKSNEYAETVAGIQSFLKQARVLSRCLNTYVEKISDSALPLVDIKPVLESLFETHDRMKKAEPGALIPDSFRSKVTEVIANVNSKFPGTCTDEKQQDTFKPTSHVQPYSTLVLADLIYARGAQDEGIAVLAEWLTKHKDIKCQSGQKKDKSLSCWWALRVESRIHLWMADVAGQNNVAYRTFINSYNEDLKEYFGKIDKKSEPTSASPRPHRVVSLDGLHAKCKMWEENRPNRKTKKESLSNSVGWRGASFAIAHDSGADNRQNTNDQQNDQQQNEQDVTTEQKAYFLLLEAEDESLRTELNFVGEESAFDELEDLYRRAAFLATVGPECLPTFDFDLSEPMIADHLVTVGLIGLTVADRMHTLARSRGDHDHATEIAREAEHFLRLGSAELNKRVAHDREKIKNNKDLYARIFSQSDWEKSANLAARAMIRLRTKE